MENASKALLIAGGILISILVLSIGVYLFANFVNMSSSYEQTRQTTAIQQFNSRFTIFEGRKDITIHEIISVVNYAKQYEKQTGIQIEINLLGNNLTENGNESVDLIIQNLDKEKFQCTAINYENGMVSYISFIYYVG